MTSYHLLPISWALHTANFCVGLSVGDGVTWPMESWNLHFMPFIWQFGSRYDNTSNKYSGYTWAVGPFSFVVWR